MDTIVGEYEFGPRSKEFFGKDIYQQDVPCAVCKTKRPNVLMIPARNQCINGWTMEYKGFWSEVITHTLRHRHLFVWTAMLRLYTTEHRIQFRRGNVWFLEMSTVC